MYDKEKGIYPSGAYVVGRDLPLGGYIFTAKSQAKGTITLYQSYANYKKEENEIMYQIFEDDFHLSLMEENKKNTYAPYKYEIEMIKNKKFNPDLINEILLNK